MSGPDDDRFIPAAELMPLAEALAILSERLVPITGAETVPLAEALYRTLAETVVAGRDVPPHDNSAVDGYAVHAADLTAAAETRLPVTGRIAAGHPLGRPARRGEALRILTGAPMPEGPDTVVMQEDCRREGDEVVLGSGVKPGANRRRRGEDIRRGDAILKPGIRLRAQEIGLAASVGRAELQVRERLKVAVFSTGDEVREPGGNAPAGCIYDANRYTVMALLRGLGCELTDLGILPDDPDTIRGALAAAATAHDLLTTSGGVSVGDEDHVKAAVEALGGLHFWRVAIKPGRPIALGRIGDATFIGLPGNPVSAMVTFMLIARPVILRLSGRTEVEPARFPVRAGFTFRKKPGRREWLRAHLERLPDGGLRAVKFDADGSGILTSMVAAEGLVEVAESAETVNEGDPLEFLPFSEMCL